MFSACSQLPTSPVIPSPVDQFPSRCFRLQLVTLSSHHTCFQLQSSDLLDLSHWFSSFILALLSDWWKTVSSSHGWCWFESSGLRQITVPAFVNLCWHLTQQHYCNDTFWVSVPKTRPTAVLSAQVDIYAVCINYSEIRKGWYSTPMLNFICIYLFIYFFYLSRNMFLFGNKHYWILKNTSWSSDHRWIHSCCGFIFVVAF